MAAQSPPLASLKNTAQQRGRLACCSPGGGENALMVAAPPSCLPTCVVPPGVLLAPARSLLVCSPLVCAPVFSALPPRRSRWASAVYRRPAPCVRTAWQSVCPALHIAHGRGLGVELGRSPRIGVPWNWRGTGARGAWNCRGSHAPCCKTARRRKERSRPALPLESSVATGGASIPFSPHWPRVLTPGRPCPQTTNALSQTWAEPRCS